VVSKGLVVNEDTQKPQVFRVTASTVNIASNIAHLYWQHVDSNGNVDDAFATATIHYGDAEEWSRSWLPMAHLIQGRIQTLEQLASEGMASRFSRNMAYTLFAKNLVDYAAKYRGMQAVTMHELEAFADVQLTMEKSGTWTVPPYFIDSVAHLAGFVMNCSDAIDTQKNYCVTPGWQNMRFAKALVSGAKYRSYVKMIPTAEDPTVYLGDVYILQDDVIIGQVGGIQFRRYPRILLNRFFSPADKASKSPSNANAVRSDAVAVPKEKAQLPVCPVVENKVMEHAPSARYAEENTGNKNRTPKRAEEAPGAKRVEIKSPDNVEPVVSNSLIDSVLRLIANEAALELSDLDDDVSFAALGIDSLMSLVISEKLRSELDIKVGGSMFMDYPTIGDLTAWLADN
jgi:iterative type I PKS product template protein